MNERRSLFRGRLLPAALALPQLALTAVFFLWPAAQAVWSSTQRQDSFGLRSTFVGLENFTDLLTDPLYRQSALRTLLFSLAVSALALGFALLFAVFADRRIRGRAIYRSLLIWPYAIAPAVAGVLWLLLLHPQIGYLGRTMRGLGIGWDFRLNDLQAMLVVILASAWKQVAYDFIFLLAGLQAIPPSVIEAAQVDGARAWRLFGAITLPLLLPTIGFLAVVNLVYASFETFGTIQALTGGGPGKATETLMIKVYRDGIVNLDYGSSAAQSVLLMLGVIGLTLLQFAVLGRSRER